MNYADAVKRVEIWRLNEMGGKMLSDADHEALAILRRAGKVMGAVEGLKWWLHKDGQTTMLDLEAQEKLIRESLAYKEQKERANG